MSKAILALEMPEKCTDCDICHSEPDYGFIYCPLLGESVDYEDEKPVRCPLRPIPENKHGYMGADNAYEEGYGYGFNACLRAIERSGENE